MRDNPNNQGWSTEKVKERVKDDRKANQFVNTAVPKGFGKGIMEPLIQINKEEMLHQSKKVNQKRINNQGHVYKMMKHQS